MKKVLLDTNFLIACIKNKIDFFEEIKFQGYKLIIPENVIRELKKISKSSQKLKTRNAAEIALELIKINPYEKIKFKKRNVDKAIKDFANSEKNIIVATLDRELKSKIEKNKMIIRNKKKLEII
jgi:rRNA-processing protein FCF1